MEITLREQEYQLLRSFVKLASDGSGTSELVGCAIAEALTPRQRQLVEMYYIRQMPMQYIAAELGICPSTVCRTLQRARSRLKTCLKYGGRNLGFLLEE